MSGDVRGFRNIETRAVIKSPTPPGKVPKEIHPILTEMLGKNVPKPGWPSLNVVILPSVMRLVLHDPKP